MRSPDSITRVIRRATLLIAFLLCVGVSAQEMSADPIGEVTSLSDAQRAVVYGAPEDDEPEERAKGVHFFVSNEMEQDVFYESIRDLGGAYVGVGSDQAYLFVGWMRPQVGWLIDYDRAVVDVHLVHQAFFLSAETPETYYAMWRKDALESSEAVLREAYADDPRLEAVVEVFRESRAYVYARYRRLRKRFEKIDVPTFLTDAETYDFIQAMVRSGRLRPMLVNLLDDAGMAGVGEAARELGLPVRVLYMSNAEQYWDYGEQFRSNIEALPVDERSLIVRTIGRKNNAFNYNTQTFDNFKAWLDLPVEDVYHIKRTQQERADGLFVTTVERLPR